MNAVIDEDLPRSFGKVLSFLGFTVFDIRNHGLRGKPDEAVFAFAQKYKAVLFSADLDFSNTITFPLGTHYGIVILRFPNEMSVAPINQMTRNFLQKLNWGDYQGNLIIVSPLKIRVRRNPQ